MQRYSILIGSNGYRRNPQESIRLQFSGHDTRSLEGGKQWVGTTAIYTYTTVYWTSLNVTRLSA